MAESIELPPRMQMVLSVIFTGMVYQHSQLTSPDKREQHEDGGRNRAATRKLSTALSNRSFPFGLFSG